MKRIGFLRAMAAALLAVPAIASAPVKTTAEVPFEFEVNGRVLPAGRYYFEAVPQRNVMTIRDESGRTLLSSIVSVADKGRDQCAGASFKRSNGRMQLKELRVSQPDSGVTLRLR